MGAAQIVVTAPVGTRARAKRHKDSAHLHVDPADADLSLVREEAAAARDSIVVVAAPRWRTAAAVALDWCRIRPRQVAASALVGLTALSGLVVPSAASTGAPTAAREPGGTAGAGTQSGQIAPAAAYYPLTPLPRPADGPVPVGKGMWIHKLDRVEGGSVSALVSQAKRAGLTHIYVRLGSSKSGFYARHDLDRLLPVAHAAGLKVVGWDFPYLHNPAADAQRAHEEMWYATPTGHRIDAFSPDIETPSEGTSLSAAAVAAYGALLRADMGPKYPLIATVPRPSSKRWFPFASLTAFDAIAPMVYWGNRDPAADVAGAIADLAFLGKPVLPVGQAYDMAIDRGPKGAPTKQAIERFIKAAVAHGAPGLSFWVWDTANADHWSAITEAKLG
jgi:hypothetical protein